MSSDELYDRDFYSWTQRQAELLRSGRLDAIDIENILEEIETLGRSERSALQSAYRLIAMHLLKMKFQPEKYARSWYVTVMRERVNAARILSENPGLKPMRAALFAGSYADACKDAAAETGLARKTFPESPPFTLDEVEDEAFLPDEIRSHREHKSD